MDALEILNLKISHIYNILRGVFVVVGIPFQTSQAPFEVWYYMSFYHPNSSHYVCMDITDGLGEGQLWSKPRAMGLQRVNIKVIRSRW